jgi:hypothetical protein
MGCGWCKCFGIPWRSLPDDFSRFYTYDLGYVHREIKVYSVFTGIFLQGFFRSLLPKPYSLFTAPQILRRPLPCFGVSKRLEFLPAFA